jgi:hypothetical protein
MVSVAEQTCCKAIPGMRRVHDVQAGSLSTSDAYRPGNVILEKVRLSRRKDSIQHD